MYSVATIIVGVFFVVFSELMITPENAVLAEFLRMFDEAFAPLGPTDILGGGIGLIFEYFAHALRESFEVSRGGLIFAIILSLFVLGATAQISGMIVGFIIRRKFKRKDTLKWYIAIPIKWGLGFAFALLFAFAMYHFVLAIIPFILAFLVFKAIQNIVEVKIVYFRERKIIGEMLNAKTAAGNLVANLILLVITAIIPVLLWIVLGFVFSAWAGFWIAVVIGTPLFIYYFQVTNFTAVRYFMDEFNKKR